MSNTNKTRSMPNQVDKLTKLKQSVTLSHDNV